MKLKHGSTSQITTIKDQVYNIIKENILNGNFKPGEKLQEKKIAEQLNVSRSPVREAIKELIGEGLLESIPNKSISVKKLSKKDIIDVFEFRTVIEKYAINKTILNLTEEKIKILDELLEELEESYHSKDLTEYCRIDVKIHDVIIYMSENMVVYNAIKNIFSLIQPFRVISLHSKKRFENSFIEHKEIIKAIKEKDFERAWSVNSTHLNLAKEQIIEHLIKEESK
ncbi:GntR family transcriptional regulator [Crassaminicella profunda]|uniref:GntR family transcriptional regulator n=1 Tax=Crassaminicella profunda TaxID=1286698 RepID=UPI001CA724AF|nr:GntR family transcriptional regulator [Crassaminicella profunda]QZY56198.1 GntR family transcriptional regulator [Crassaminicella profunda]